MQVFNILKSDNIDEFEKKLHAIEVDSILSKSLKELPEIMHNQPSLIAIAAFHGAIKCFNFLYHSDADLNVIDQNNRNILHFAACGGNIEIIHVLESLGVFELQRMAKTPDNDGRTSFHFAAMYDQLNYFQYFWTRGFTFDDKDVFNMKPIHYAVQNNSLNVLTFYLDNGENPNSYIPTEKKRLLTFAIENNHPEAVKLLLQHNADVQKEMSKSCNLTPLMYAASHNYVDILELLLINSPKSVNQKNASGWTALHFAAASGNLEACQKLIEFNANLELKTPFGQTPINLAITRRHTTVVSFLEENGGNPEPNEFLFETTNIFDIKK